jgi:hypothetical protein
MAMTNALQFPWSGDVSQWINPMTSWFTGNSSSLVSVNYASSNPKVEEKIVRDVAGYGRQLGKISAVLEVLVDLPDIKKQLKPEQQTVIDAFCDMAQAICEAKEHWVLEQMTPTNLRLMLREINALKTTNPDLHKTLLSEVQETLFPKGK